MVRKAAQKSRSKVAREALSSSKRQTGTKESPILLSSDDEGEREECVRRPLPANAVPQKRYLGVSPSDPYTFKGHGGAYDAMIAMGYKPDRGLGPTLRGNVRPLSIELRKLRAGVGYRTTSASRSPSPVPPPKKAPVKIIRPPREPIASTSKIEPPVKATPQTRSQRKVKAQKAALPKLAPSNPPPSPPKSSAPTQKSSPPPTVLSPPPTPASFAPSDLYISLMSGLAMANMPQAMQVAAAADPMAAFQLAQMCFAPSPFPLPPFSLAPSQPDHAPGHRHLHPHPPNRPPKPILNSTTKLSNKATPVPPPPSSTTLPEGNPNHTHPSPSTSASDTSTTIEMDPQILKQRRLARKINIGWIPEPGFPDRGTFTLVPTTHYVHWSTSEGDTPPDPRRSLVMEDLPGDCRTMEFVRSWADKFSATAVHLNGGPKALIEFPSREVAEVAYDSPRLRGGLFERATHVRVFWYRPQTGDAVPSSTVTTDGSAGVTKEVKDALGDANPKANTTTLEVVPVETSGTGKGARLKGKGKASSLPPPELDLMDVDLPVRSTTVPMSAQKPSLLLAVAPSTECDQVDRTTNGSLEGLEHTTSLSSFISSSPSAPPTPPTQVPSPHPRSPTPETIQRTRTPTGSPPSLRYPSSTPEGTNEKSRMPSPGEENPGHDTRPLASASDSPTVDSSLEQQLRMRLLAMKQARIANRSCERSASSSTAFTVIDPDPDSLSKTASPPPISATPSGIAISESLELLATSFITDTIQAVQGLPSEPERLDNGIKARLGLKRGSRDAFGSSADIAFKRQRLAQQIEESKRIMEQWKAAKTREERNQIYALWEESNRSVELLSKPVTMSFQWPCYAEGWLVVDSDDEDMDLS